MRFLPIHHHMKYLVLLEEVIQQPGEIPPPPRRSHDNLFISIEINFYQGVVPHGHLHNCVCTIL